MNRAEVLQEVRLMKFEDVYSRRTADKLTQEQAAEILGVSVRTVRRWEDRFEADGAEGLYDRRLGKLANNRVPTDTVMEMLTLFDSKYWDYTPKHFHEKLVEHHGFTQSYNWLRLTLQSHGRIQPAPRRGAHRRKRPRRPMVGMMLHQDGSSHEWVPDQWWDLIVTMDDANSRVYSAFFVSEEGTMSSFRALTEVINAHGLFCSLYADRGSHYWHTPEAGGKVDKENLTQVGRALQQLGITDPGLFATGPRAVGAHVRHVSEPIAAGAAIPWDHDHARGQPVPERGLSSRTQWPVYKGAGGHGFGLRPVYRPCYRPCARYSVRTGRTRRRQRQHGALQGPGPADRGEQAPSSFRQGEGQGPRLS